MYKKVIKSDDTEIEEGKFYYHKIPISIIDIYANEIVGSNKLPYGKQDFKCFIGYKGNNKTRPLCILLPKYKRYFDRTKYTYFKIQEEIFLINI